LDQEAELQKNPEHIKFLCEMDGDTADDIYTYNQDMDFIERDNFDWESDTEHLYRFWHITAHQGPLRTSDKDYKGSPYNVLVEWESGETTYEPIDMIGKDDPVTCAEYALLNGLMNIPGWKQFCHLTINQKKVERLANQAKLRTFCREPFWKFGFLVPRSHNQKVEIDISNGNLLWQESEAIEMKQLAEYNTFIDKRERWYTNSW
jgi:hypothetical protein